MRLTILAGLITGASLAMQPGVAGHPKPKVVPMGRAVRIRFVAPWYIADNGCAASQVVRIIQPQEGPLKDRLC